MKNKLLKFFALALSIIMIVSVFAACDNSQGGGEGHVHTYDRQIADETTFKEDATCEHGPLYYYTCACGEKGTETFEDGRALEHEYDQKVEQDKYLEYEGDCQNPTTYYYSCKCGLASQSETFVSDEVIDHDYVDGACSICGEPE